MCLPAGHGPARSPQRQCDERHCHRRVVGGGARPNCRGVDGRHADGHERGPPGGHYHRTALRAPGHALQQPYGRRQSAAGDDPPGWRSLV